MMITLTIRPEVEAELARQAQLSGRALEAYAANLLEEAAHLSLEAAPLPTEPTQDQPKQTGAALVEACAKIRGLLTDEEVDTLFARNPSVSRTVSFE